VEDAKWFLILGSKELRTSALLPFDSFIYLPTFYSQA